LVPKRLYDKGLKSAAGNFAVLDQKPLIGGYALRSSSIVLAYWIASFRECRARLEMKTY
jgi:hypothetical protein